MARGEWKDWKAWRDVDPRAHEIAADAEDFVQELGNEAPTEKEEDEQGDDK